MIKFTVNSYSVKLCRNVNPWWFARSRYFITDSSSEERIFCWITYTPGYKYIYIYTLVTFWHDNRLLALHKKCKRVLNYLFFFYKKKNPMKIESLKIWTTLIFLNLIKFMSFYKRSFFWHDNFNRNFLSGNKLVIFLKSLKIV